MVTIQVPPGPEDLGTKERLVREAVRLFAERGFRGTTVADIEAAAGLSPGAGGLYKHFRTKHDLLRAAVERHVAEAETMAGVMALLPLQDLRSELTVLARWFMAALDQRRPVIRVLERDGEQFPDLVALIWEAGLGRAYRETAELIRRRAKKVSAPSLGPDAVAAVLLGSIMNYRRTQWTFGHEPGGVAEEVFVDTIVEIATRLLDGGP